MAVRQTALTAFYGGPVWKANRTAANATILDSDNVLLLKPVQAGAETIGIATPRHAGSLTYAARIYTLDGVNAEAFSAVFRATIVPLLHELGATPIMTLVSHSAPNNFPALPVRHDGVFVWIGRWPSIAAERQFEENWNRLTGWRDAVPEHVLPALMRKPERLRLMPTTRSAPR